ncbi:YjdJ family protein [Lentibacillus sp. N15]|uniref:YjdJ family protein n=1 Tax=Lentibacillus songyuanensis TaxID=3136161 RepID=UPI0031BB20CA
MKYTIQYLVSLVLLVFSTLVTWYEGSAIREDPWNWKYTAFFSKMFNGEVANSSDISQLDHFIYAAKYSPIYPTLMY